MFVGRCGWGQVNVLNCQVVGSLTSFVDVLDFLGVLISVCDRVAGCFSFKRSCSVMVVICCWIWCCFLIEQLCVVYRIEVKCLDIKKTFVR